MHIFEDLSLPVHQNDVSYIGIDQTGWPVRENNILHTIYELTGPLDMFRQMVSTLSLRLYCTIPSRPSV